MSIPRGAVSFAPHQSSAVSLDRVSTAIKDASSSVLFAVMDIDQGGGDVLKLLRASADREQIFDYGVTQSTKGVKLHKPGSRRGVLVPVDYLRKQVPATFAPFEPETGGGSGQIIHHKFVVVDFNSSDPVVFSGSSNLSSGGETANGDNLLAISDAGVATAFAVEAVRLIDHYHFRVVMKASTRAKPLKLQHPNDHPKKWWWEQYYDPDDLRQKDRLLFAQGH